MARRIEDLYVIVRTLKARDVELSLKPNDYFQLSK